MHLLGGFKRITFFNLLFFHRVVVRLKPFNACRGLSSDWNVTGRLYMSVTITSLFFLQFKITYLYL